MIHFKMEVKVLQAKNAGRALRGLAFSILDGCTSDGEVIFVVVLKTQVVKPETPFDLLDTEPAGRH